MEAKNQFRLAGKVASIRHGKPTNVRIMVPRSDGKLSPISVVAWDQNVIGDLAGTEEGDFVTLYGGLGNAKRKTEGGEEVWTITAVVSEVEFPEVVSKGQQPRSNRPPPRTDKDAPAPFDDDDVPF